MTVLFVLPCRRRVVRKTFSQHVASMLSVADINVGDVPRINTQRLIFINRSYSKNTGYFKSYKCCAKSMECTSSSVKIGINYSHTKTA